MLSIRPAGKRGHANHGWLDSNFSFSFADYYDPKHMGFRALRVINEDYVAPARGFGKHPHRDMEILTYVLEGAVRHEDSLGSSEVLVPGELQLDGCEPFRPHCSSEVLVPGELQHMSAGKGVLHSEMNPSQDETLHLLQIWLIPNKMGIQPVYEQKRFAVQDEPNRLHLLASKDGRDGSFVIQSDAELLAAKLTAGGSATHTFRGGHGWLQVARGLVKVGELELVEGDGLEISGEAALTIVSEVGGEVLLFDLD